MEPIAASSLIAAGMEDRTTEIADFDAVIRHHWARVFRFALASLRDHDAAQTVTQDCFVRAYRGRERFRGAASLQTWLMQIAVNLVRDHARNRRLQFWKRAPSLKVEETSREGLRDHGIDPEQRVLVKEQVDAVWSAVARLTETQRTVFLLRYVEELQLLQIVEATGLTEGAVKVHLYRALRSVREKVGRLR